MRHETLNSIEDNKKNVATKISVAKNINLISWVLKQSRI